MPLNVCRKCGAKYDISIKNCPFCNTSATWVTKTQAYPNGAKAINSGLGSDSSSPSGALLSRAIEHHNSCEYGDALKLYEQVISMHPNSDDVAMAKKRVHQIYAKRPGLKYFSDDASILAISETGEVVLRSSLKKETNVALAESNRHRDSFDDAFIIREINDATFQEWNQYCELYDNSQSIDSVIDIMHPSWFNKIIVNACDALTELGMNLIKDTYHERYGDLSDSDRRKLMPTIDMHRSILKSLVPNPKVIDMEINNYSLVYGRFVEKIQKARSTSRTVGSAAIGGAVGALFGPIGAIIGGIAASAMSDENIEEELKRTGNELQRLHSSVCKSMDNLLESAAKQLYACLVQYDDAAN